MEVVPDSTTIWKFRERLADSGKDAEVWNELQRQLDDMNLEVKKSIIQDASSQQPFLVMPGKPHLVGRMLGPAVA
jgi:IS5 family transposase